MFLDSTSKYQENRKSNQYVESQHNAPLSAVKPSH